MAERVNTLQEWRDLAEDDLRSAEFLADNLRPLPTGIVSFLCQQAAEKQLKAYLVEKTAQEPPHIHDLDELCKRCERVDPGFRSVATACSVLSEFAVKGRYDRGIDVDEADMRTVLAYAKAVRDFVTNSLAPRGRVDSPPPIR